MNKKDILWKLMFLLIIFWYIFLIIMNLTPKKLPQELFITNDKSFRLDYLIHFTAFFFLGILHFALKYLKRENEMILRDYIFIAFSIMIGVVLEFAQKFIATRSFNPLDLLFNLVGILLGYILLIVFQRIRLKTRN